VVLDTLTPTAAKMLASRARRRVHGAAVPDADLARQREVGAARAGISVVRGAAAVAEQVLATGGLARMAQPALVNGAVGVIMTAQGQPFAVVAFTVRQGKIAEIDILGDPARLSRLDLAVPPSPLRQYERAPGRRGGNDGG